MANVGIMGAAKKFLSLGLEEEPYRPPEKRTWAEKVTDDGNAWLAARRLEMEGDLDAAADAYAADAKAHMERGFLARAALSLACESRCRWELGRDADDVFRRAGDVYMMAARDAMRRSPRDALHLADCARECYERSGSADLSKEAARIAESLRGALDRP